MIRSNCSAPASMDQFPELPLELDLAIFERLVEEDPSSALQLASVCKTVQDWVEPRIYQAVVLRDSYALAAFANTIRKGRRPSSFYETNVKVVCISFTILAQAYQDFDNLLVVLEACNQLTTLVLWSFVSDARETELRTLLRSGALPNLQRLCCRTQYLRDNDQLPVDFTLLLFQSITHLELDLDTNHVEELPRLNSVTHLSLCASAIDLIWELPQIHLPSNLVVCLLFSTVFRKEGKQCVTPKPQSNLEHDPRIVFGALETQILESNEYSYSIVQRPGKFPGSDNSWLSGRGKPDMWELAENIVALRADIAAEEKRLAATSDFKLKIPGRRRR
ncbi:hypothetical protein C8J56DRAFT_1167577 [Mycena floridula]|nr:hypothetical protein C8J56DRAFT_1167577 [Mycena floridula]